MTAKVTTSAAHGYSNGASITIGGATQSQYNGVFVIANASGSVFDITIASLPGVESSSTMTASAAGSTTVTATSAAAHGFANGNTVTISGASPGGYNNSYVIGGVTKTDVGSAIAALQTGAPVQYSTAAAPTTANGLVPSNNMTLVGAKAGGVVLGASFTFN